MALRRRHHIVVSLIFVILVATICLPINGANAQVQNVAATKLVDEPYYKETFFVITTNEETYHILVKANITLIGEETYIYLNATLVNPHNASITATAYIPDTLTDAPYYSGLVEAFLLHLEAWVVTALKMVLPIIVIVALILQIYFILEEWIGDFLLTALKTVLFGGPLIYASLPWVLLTLLRDTNPDGTFDLYVPWSPPSPHINLVLNGHYYVATSLSWWEIKEYKVYAPWPFNWIVLYTYYGAMWVRSRITQPPPKIPPSASFYWTPTQPIANEVVTFASTSFDSDGLITKYEWWLGDGNQKTEKNFTHTYHSVGDYNVTLRVTDNDGLTNNVTHTIRVQPITTAKLRVIPDYLDVSGPIGQSVVTEFAVEESLNQTDLIGVSFQASDLVENAGNYTIHKENVSFNKNMITIAKGSYSNVTATFYVPSHSPIGWYVGNITANSENGGNATIFIDLYVFGPPIANFTWNPLIARVGETVTFDGSMSLPSGWPIVDYTWSFGDSGTATGQVVPHVFLNQGLYSVTLNVTDSKGMWDIEQKQIRIVQPHGPKAEFTVTPETTHIGEVVKFDASSSLSGWNGTHNMPITEYRWNFGDGNETTTSNSIIFHRFNSMGFYYVTLTVYSRGATPEIDTITHRVTVISIPVGGFSVSLEKPKNNTLSLIYFTVIIALATVFTSTRRKRQKKA